MPLIIFAVCGWYVVFTMHFWPWFTVATLGACGVYIGWESLFDFW